ncbi:MAG: RNA polymerase sigma factor [Candidatus Omnitrophica bacterium]|nr:RNA polymerase sigma factor [Candidatus Omnitrophota bacterium]
MTNRITHCLDHWLENMYREYYRWAVNMAHRFIHNRDEAEDIAQEAFLRIYIARFEYQPTAQFKTYLYQIIRNLCVDFFRNERLKEQLDAADLPLSDGSHKNSIDRIEAEENLARLPNHVRNIFILYYLENRSYKEIARILNIPENAVGNILYYWRKKITKKK